MPTRLYFPQTTAAPVTPSVSPDAGWNYTSEVLYRKLIRAVDRADAGYATGTQVGPWTATAGQKAVDRVYVSEPLIAQTISGTVKGQLQVREFATTDNADQIVVAIKVVNNAGSSVRGTLLSLNAYATASEFPNSTTLANRFIADGDALSSVSAQDGDRLVVEIGYKNTTSATTPEAAGRWGAVSGNSDLPENQTDTSTNLNPWIEFSGTVTFQGSVTGSSDGTASVTGTLTGTGALSGSASVASSVTGTLTEAPVLGPVTGSVAAVSSVSGTLTGTGAVTGTAAVVSSVTATLRGDGALSGSSAGTANVTGALTATGALTGAVAGAGAVSGALTGTGALTGSVAGVSAVTGTASEAGSIGALTGAVAAVSSVAGTLTDYSAPAGGSSTTTAAGGGGPAPHRVQKYEDERRAEIERRRAALRRSIEAAYDDIKGVVAAEEAAEPEAPEAIPAEIPAEVVQAVEIARQPEAKLADLREVLTVLRQVQAALEAERDDEEALLLAA